MLLLFTPALATLAFIVALQLTEQWGGHNRTASATEQEAHHGR